MTARTLCLSSDNALMHSPGNVTVSKVVGSVWSYDRQLLCSPFEALCSLDGDTLAPTYNCQVGSHLHVDSLRVLTTSASSRKLVCICHIKYSSTDAATRSSVMRQAEQA